MRKPTVKLLAVLAAMTLISSSAAAVVTVETATATTNSPGVKTSPGHHDTTDPAEAERVDRVPVDSLVWQNCAGLPAHFQCADFNVPMDYDQPNGQQYTLAIMKRVANNGAKKKGSLFINPGGPGGSAVGSIPGTERFLSPQLLDEFDMIGVDPRGIGGSHIANCFNGDLAAYANIRDQISKYDYSRSTLDSMRGALANKALADACSTTGSDVLRHMSTAEVARDMDVVRRAVGDDKLTFLGFSYGSYLGAVYGNMFPDRVRAIVNDGVINPADWTGTHRNNQNMNQDNRLLSAVAAEKAMHESFKRCAEAGAELCGLAKHSADDKTAQAKFLAVLERVKEKPLTISLAPDFEIQLTDGIYAQAILSTLYGASGAEDVAALTLLAWNAMAGTETESTLPVMRAAKLLRRAATTATAEETQDDGAAMYLGVACSDARHPRTVSENARRAYDSRYLAPILGQVWAWSSVPCSPNAWQSQDPHSYYGPFGKTTANGMLFVGALWDPATAHGQAVAAARVHPGSSFISVNNWGHTSYGASSCATTAIDEYLLNGKQPGTLTCADADQPFTPWSPPMATADRPGLVVPFKPFQLHLKGM